jgi:hypothetical protein
MELNHPKQVMERVRRGHYDVLQLCHQASQKEIRQVLMSVTCVVFQLIIFRIDRKCVYSLQLSLSLSLSTPSPSPALPLSLPLSHSPSSLLPSPSPAPPSVPISVFVSVSLFCGFASFPSRECSHSLSSRDYSGTVYPCT